MLTSEPYSYRPAEDLKHSAIFPGAWQTAFRAQGRTGRRATGASQQAIATDAGDVQGGRSTRLQLAPLVGTRPAQQNRKSFDSAGHSDLADFNALVLKDDRSVPAKSLSVRKSPS